MESDIYREQILEHHRSPRHKGRLNRASVSAEGSNMSCGDHLSLSLRWDGKKLVDGRFQGEGCALSLAACDILLDNVIGMTAAKIAALSPGDMYDMLGVAVNPSRTGCALLGLKTLTRVAAEHAATEDMTS
ncbi:MAG: iron-sulfur cluster assembly scaffold protein [Candidatus Yonathbacteria bacterium]|nr:iron-sulfur cluster assembly scaffold protein [Candidatus Yonathbacteria bacterium]